MITYGQLVTLFGDEIAWGRVYIRNTEKTEWHNDIERRESIRLYGDRAETGHSGIPLFDRLGGGGVICRQNTYGG